MILSNYYHNYGICSDNEINIKKLPTKIKFYPLLLGPSNLLYVSAQPMQNFIPQKKFKLETAYKHFD